MHVYLLKQVLFSCSFRFVEIYIDVHYLKIYIYIVPFWTMIIFIEIFNKEEFHCLPKILGFYVKKINTKWKDDRVLQSIRITSFINLLRIKDLSKQLTNAKRDKENAESQIDSLSNILFHKKKELESVQNELAR